MKKILFAVILILLAVMSQSSNPEDNAKKARQIEENIQPYLNEEQTESEAIEDGYQEADNINSSSNITNKTNDVQQVQTDKEIEKQLSNEIQKSIKTKNPSLSNASSTIKSDNNSVETKPTQSAVSKDSNQVTSNTEKVVDDTSPKKEKVIPQYHAGNSGLLLNSEDEAYQEAEKKFSDFSDTEKYVNNYVVYSTYDKWSINYYYTYW